MEKKDPKKWETSTKEERDFNREDSGRSERFSTPFAKDKRKRITRVEKTEPQRKSPEERERDAERLARREEQPRKPYSGGNERRSYEGRNSDRPARRDDAPRKPYSGNNERRSFNPNFTEDNKPKWGKPSSGGGERNFNSRDYNDNRANRDERRPYNNDSDDRGERRPYRDNPRGVSFGNSSEPDRFNRVDGYKPPRKNTGSAKPGKFSKPGDKGGDKFRKKRTPASDNGRYADGTYPTFPAAPVEGEMRLNRYVAASGMSSRREADEVIRSGRVTVNGEVVTEMGSKIKPGDIVQVDGQTVRSEKKVYIVMNKPKGFVTTLEDPFAEKTVMDLLKNSCSERVYPVGRLDKNSLGVLLITNDGDLTKRLTHPSYNKKKIYQVTLNKALTKADMQQIVDGIELEDGVIQADAVDYVDGNKKEVGIEIHSGRNRIVRRIFEHLGYKVGKLDRVYFAGLTKKNLKRGQWRFLSPKEVDILKSGLYE